MNDAQTDISNGTSPCLWYLDVWQHHAGSLRLQSACLAGHIGWFQPALAKGEL
jgi:hypothetical protein